MSSFFENSFLSHILTLITPTIEAEGGCPVREGRLFISRILGWDSLMWIRGLPPLTSEEEERLLAAAHRRKEGEPLSRILGEREFWSLPFQITPHTLDPRPDSECLVESVLNLLAQRGITKGDNVRFLDLGTGSGCLLLSLLHEFPHGEGVGIDIFPPTLETARFNAQRLHMQARTTWICSHWTDALSPHMPPFDVILSNPPYIETSTLDKLERAVQQYDPVRALDGGLDGLEAYRHLIPACKPFLKEHGFLICEIGIGQHHDLKMLYDQGGFHTVKFHADLTHRIRCVSGWV